MAKIRLGCLPIRLETGRYSRPRLLENERICQVCYQGNLTNNPYIGEVESEVHFLFNCNRYKDLRKLWLERLTLTSDFCLLNVFQKLDIVLNHPENVKITAQFLINAYYLRSKTLINLKLCKTLPNVTSIPPTNLNQVTARNSAVKRNPPVQVARHCGDAGHGEQCQCHGAAAVRPYQRVAQVSMSKNGPTLSL